MSRKIIGVTVGTQLPKPNFKQTDPTKGDYIKNKPDFEGLKSKVDDIDANLDTKADLVDGKIPVEQLPDDIGGGVNSWNDLADKPFYEEGLSFTVPSDVSALPAINSQPLEALGGMSFTFVKVNEAFNTPEETYGALIKVDNDGNILDFIIDDSYVNNLDNGFALISFNGGFYPLVINANTVGTTVLPTADMFGEDMTFNVAETGCYVLYIEGMGSVISYSNGELKQLDEKFIPDIFIKSAKMSAPNGIATLDANGKIPVSQLPDDIGGGVTSWNDLTDKPFYEEGWSIEWDGAPTDTFVEVMDGMGLYKASDSTPTKEELIGAIYIGADGEGRPTEFVLAESDIADFNADCYGLENTPCFLITTRATKVEMLGMTLPFPSAGTWFISFGLPMSLSKGELKQLDPKFIPNYFGEIGTKIIWDGTPTSVYESFDMDGTTGYFYKVSEPVDTIIDGICTIQADGGMEIPLSPDTVQVIDGSENGIYIVNVKVPNSTFDFSNTFGGTVTFREIGLYFFYANMNGEEGKTTSFTSSDYGIKQIDKKYIPDDIVASVSLTFDEVPTEGSQNPVKSMGIYSAISALEGKITSTFCYKGTVDNYSDLPSLNNTIGDVWHIANADETNGVNAGDNAAWNGTSWDILAGVIDLSNYYTKTEIDSIALNGTINLINYYTKSEIDDIIGNCDSIINSINTLVGGGNV